MRTFSNTRLAATAASAALLAGVSAVTVYDQIPLALATTGTAVSERLSILFSFLCYLP
jgi:predicted porin